MKNQKVIDIHSHLFNAAYLPVEGIFLSFFEDDSSEEISPLKRIGAWAAAKIFTSPTPSKLSKINSNRSWIQKVETEEFKTLIIGFSTELAAFIETLKNKSKITNDESELLNAVEWICKEEFSQERKRRRHFATKENVGDSIQKFIYWLLININSDYTSFEAERKIRFALLLIVTSTSVMAEHLLETYSSKKDIEILLISHLMMDMEYGYTRFDKDTKKPSKPKISYKAQVKNIEKLNHAFSGKLLGFVAFDPRREDGLKIVHKAISQQGFCGVKFYPSMGYLPEKTLQIKAEIDGVNQNLFDYCSKNSLPILVHCKPGSMEASKGWDKNGHPKNWDLVLRNYENLVLCFGHAGGGVYKFRIDDWNKSTIKSSIDRFVTEYGWFTKGEAMWNQEQFHFARDVVRLCNSYKNVYCDFSILSDLLPDRGEIDTGDAKDWLKQTLIRLIHDNGSKLKEKIMYGSDWHMPTVLGVSFDYLRAFLDIFSDPKLKDFSDLFFYKNALRFLNLENYIERNKVNGWISAKSYDQLANIKSFIDYE